MLAIRLPADIERRLDALEDIDLAERALEEIRAGKVKTVPLDDVMREYGLEN